MHTVLSRCKSGARVRAQLITLDKAEGHDLKGIVYLRTVGEADDLIAEMQAGSSPSARAS